MVAVRQLVSAVMSSTASAAPIPPWVYVCGQLAPIASVIVFMAPIPTIQQINRDRTVGNLPLLPYSSMIASAFLWVTYGILKHEAKIWLSNGIGLVLGSYYFFQFIQLAPKISPTLPGSILQHMQAIAAVITVALLITVASPLFISSPASYIGNAGVVFCVAMFASPLAALQSVLATKSARSIPLPFTIASLVNCFLWSVSGLFEMHDVYIYLPNLLGLTFSLAQVALKLIYGDGPPSPRYGPVELLPM
jgi:solute carrier family 50 (sugar transporter)